MTPKHTAELREAAAQVEKAMGICDLSLAHDEWHRLASPDRIIALLDAFEECVKALTSADETLDECGYSATSAERCVLRAAISKALP